MPYRVDFRTSAADALDRLIDLGAIDVEPSLDGRVAALMPDRVAPEQIAGTRDVEDLAVSPAIARDAESIWVLSRPSVRIGCLTIAPADARPGPGTLRLIDSAAFGTGLHPTTALCLEALEEAVRHGRTPDAVLDVGTGSGVLALGALMMGVPRATGIDVEGEAVRAAAESARINSLERRLHLVRGAPDALAGTWPLVMANVLAAPLIEMAPALVRRVGHHGRLVLSGVPAGVQQDVDHAYRRLGMRSLRVTSRAGWVALALQASW